MISMRKPAVDGKSTTHATTVVVYQKKPFGPMPSPKVHTDHVGREISLTRISAYDEI